MNNTIHVFNYVSGEPQTAKWRIEMPITASATRTDPNRRVMTVLLFLSGSPKPETSSLSWLLTASKKNDLTSYVLIAILAGFHLSVGKYFLYVVQNTYS